MSAHGHFNSFNAGEISPLMVARVDAEKQRFSCRRLENFIPRIYGGAFRRPGMEWIGEVLDGSKKVRLIPFNYSPTTRYIIEIGDLYMRFWTATGTLVSLTGGVPSLTTPWTESQIFDVQFVQLNDVFYFVHPSHHPKRLTRQSEATWEFVDVPWTFPCFQDANSGAVTVDVSNAAVGTGRTLHFSDASFFPNQSASAARGQGWAS